MTRFLVKGPFLVDFQKNPAGKAITPSEGKLFWDKHPALKKELGCYVFGIRASKGMKPLYIGKATKSFGQEVFSSHKLAKYMEGLSHSKKGAPILFFVCLPKQAGPKNKKSIDELESYLIQAGLKANFNLLNDKKTKIESWSIAGVLRDRPGQPTISAQDFKKLMNM
jgi:hypothetical protein